MERFRAKFTLEDNAHHRAVSYHFLEDFSEGYQFAGFQQLTRAKLEAERTIKRVTRSVAGS